MGMEEVISELNWLVTNGIIADYAIGGAVAAFLYIEPAFTQDLDVFVVFSGEPASSLDPLGPLWAALIKRGAKVDREYLVIGGWRVQFLPPGTELYDEAIANARSIRFGDVSGKVMTPDYLAATALATGRGKDFVRVEEFIARNLVDKVSLLALVERFGLTERWKAFEKRFLVTDG